MLNSYKKVLPALSILAWLCFLQTPAEATRSFTIAQTPSSVEYPIGATQPITFQVTNNSTAGETITTVRFNVSNTYTLLPNPEVFVQPTGWNCVRSSNTRITCTASSAAYYILPNSSYNFTFNINSAALSTDYTTGLSSANARFSGSTTWRTPNSTTSSWTWKSLLMTLVPAPTSVGNGCQFTLTMSVTNKTSVALTAIAPVPSPRTTATTTNASVNNPTPSPNPPSLNLNAGATGTITWTYTLTGAAGGAVSFNACASTTGSCTTVSGTSRTSSSVTSGTVNLSTAVCGFNIISFTNNPACLYAGDTATFVMVVSNTTGAALSNVAPSALVSVLTGSAAFGAFTGPVPASIATVNTGATGTFTWTAPVAGNPNDSYAVQGYATATGGIVSSTVTSTVQDVDGYNIIPNTVNPATTNAGSSNAEIIWSITNWACYNINQVSITVPGGWTLNDAYAIVTNTTGTQQVEWPPVGTTFTASIATDRIPPSGKGGSFSLFFSQTPSTTGNYTFNVTITDDAPTPVTKIIPTTVVVSPFNTGSLNSTNTGLWFENIR